MTLIHYAFEPVSLEPRSFEQSADMKPNGLWVSDGTEWLDWCRSEEFRTDKPWYSHAVTVAPEARILTLTSVEEILAFNRRFGVERGAPGMTTYIAWDQVAAEHDGIVIAPYQWACRNGRGTFWYYGWDVASGCIWNTSVVSLGEPFLVEFAEAES